MFLQFELVTNDDTTLVTNDNTTLCHGITQYDERKHSGHLQMIV